MAATDAKTNLARARVREGEPFTPLGVHRQRYFFRCAYGIVTWHTAGELSRIGAALMLLPDLDHWRGLYPREGHKHGGVNWAAVGADLIRMATEAGEYQPKAGEGPAPIGRPRLPEEEKRRRAEARKARRRDARKLAPPAHVVAWAKGRRD